MLLQRPITYNFQEDQKDYCMAILSEEELKGRFKKLSEIPPFLRLFYDWEIRYDPNLLLKGKLERDKTQDVLIALYEEIGNLKTWEIGEKEKLESTVFNLRDKLGIGNLEILHPLRIALTGQKNSPSWLLMLSYLGFAESMNRLEQAIVNIEEIKE